MKSIARLISTKNLKGFEHALREDKNKTLPYQYNEYGQNLFQECGDKRYKKFLKLLNEYYPEGKKASWRQVSKDVHNTIDQIVNAQLKGKSVTKLRMMILVPVAIASMKNMAKYMQRMHASSPHFEEGIAYIERHLFYLSTVSAYVEKNWSGQGKNQAVRALASCVPFYSNHVEPELLAVNRYRLLQAILADEFDSFAHLIESGGNHSCDMPLFTRTITLQPENRIVANMLTILSSMAYSSSIETFISGSVLLGILSPCAPQSFLQRFPMLDGTIFDAFNLLSMQMSQMKHKESQQHLYKVMGQRAIMVGNVLFEFNVIQSVIIKQLHTLLSKSSQNKTPSTSTKRKRLMTANLDQDLSTTFSQIDVGSPKKKLKSRPKLEAGLMVKVELRHTPWFMMNEGRFHEESFLESWARLGDNPQSLLGIDQNTGFFEQGSEALFHLLVASALVGQRQVTVNKELERYLKKLHEGVYYAHRDLGLALREVRGLNDCVLGVNQYVNNRLNERLYEEVLLDHAYN